QRDLAGYVTHRIESRRKRDVEIRGANDVALDVACSGRHVFPVPDRFVVNHQDVVAHRHQSVDEMRAAEPRAPRNQDLHCSTSLRDPQRCFVRLENFLILGHPLPETADASFLVDSWPPLQMLTGLSDVADVALLITRTPVAEGHRKLLPAQS